VPDADRTHSALVLEVVGGPHAGQSFPLSGSGPAAVGQQPDPHITLAADLSLSRVHGSLRLIDDIVRASDLACLGGTFVNGAGVERTDVNLRDRFRY
jgi:hypothetical protein